jgi:hypothetical protein
LIISVLADTIDSRLEHSLERPATPAYARSHIVPPNEVGVYHCMARCVRRAFLCGVDPLTKHGSRQPGRPNALAALAVRRGKAWLQGSNAAALAFR